MAFRHPIRSILSIAILAFSQYSFASIAKPGSIYFNLEAGLSSSNQAQINVTTSPSGWDFTPDGYNSNLGNSEILGLGIGYVINPLLRTELNIDRRGSFQYQKFQTSTGQFGNKTRYFDLTNTTIMANLFLEGSGLPHDLSYHSTHFTLDPFVGAGVGVAFNTVSNFYTIPVGSSAKVSTMNSHTQTSFAYQLGAGVNLITQKSLSFGIGYRYLDAGNFSSDNYLTDLQLTAIPWTGKLRTNEIYAVLRYAIT